MIFAGCQTDLQPVMTAETNTPPEPASVLPDESLQPSEAETLPSGPVYVYTDTVPVREEHFAELSLAEYGGFADEVLELEISVLGKITKFTEGEDLDTWLTMLCEGEILDAVVKTYTPNSLPAPGDLFSIALRKNTGRFDFTVVNKSPTLIRCQDVTGALVFISGTSNESFANFCDAVVTMLYPGDMP